MFSVSNFYQVTKVNRKTKAKVAEGLAVGDKIILSVNLSGYGHAATVEVSRYQGSGDDRDPSNYKFLGVTSQGKLTEYINTQGSPAVLIKSFDADWPTSGQIDRIIEEEFTDFGGIGESSYGYFRSSKVTRKLSEILLKHNKEAKIEEDEKMRLDSLIKDTYRKMTELPEDASDSEVGFLKGVIYDELRLFTKAYDVDERYLGI